MNESLASIDGERSIPSVNTTNTARWKRGGAGLLFAAVVGVAGFFVYLKYISKASADQAPVQRDLASTSTVPARTFVLAPEPVSAMPVVAAPVVVPAPIPVRSYAPRKPKPSIDRSASRSAVAVDTPANGVQVAQAQTNGQAPTGGLFGSGQSGSSELGQSLQSTNFKSTVASQLGDRNYLLTRGAFIDCVLTTRLDSTVPGMTSCRVTRDVFSSNGKVVLLEAGSTVTGEYRANLAQGMNRIFVLWSRVETPKGVVVSLDSPGTDSLGASGVPGRIDTHFWQRFGGAMLLSLIDDAAQIAVNNSNNNNDTRLILGSASNVASDLAAEVLRNTINIPPSLHANQGARIGIFVARDVDFKAVYSVQ